MADNTKQSADETIATDDIAGVKYQRMKLTLGADGVNSGDVSAANPMPVEPRSLVPVIYEDGDVLYVCKATPGSALSDPVWQIIKLDMTTGLIGKYADGNANFDNVATDLATVAALSYS